MAPTLTPAATALSAAGRQRPATGWRRRVTAPDDRGADAGACPPLAARARRRGTAAGERPGVTACDDRREGARDDRREGARENGGTAARGTRGGATVARSRRGARTAIRL